MLLIYDVKRILNKIDGMGPFEICLNFGIFVTDIQSIRRDGKFRK